MKSCFLSLLVLLTTPVVAGQDGKPIAGSVFKQELAMLEQGLKFPNQAGLRAAD